MASANPTEYAYLEVPARAELRSCVGLVLAGMAMRAKVGVGGLEEAVEILEGVHLESGPTRYRFSLDGDRVIAEVEDQDGEGPGWRTVVELAS